VAVAVNPEPLTLTSVPPHLGPEAVVALPEDALVVTPLIEGGDKATKVTGAAEE
jgi:hypothetical protein